MAGYECSDKINYHGDRVDLLSQTRHIELINEDYARLAQFHIRTAREGIRWSQVERLPYEYDWAVVKAMLAAGRWHNIQQVWDVCHFGFPDGLTPFHPKFTHRFVSLCLAFAAVYFRENNGPLIITPINEVSFLSWLGGDAGATVPYCTGSGWKVKYALMRAYIAAVAALKEQYDNVIILSTEPLVNIVPPVNAAEQDIINARLAHEDQFQAMDILTGRICPELGGKPGFLDIIGLNYYYDNQFEINSNIRLPWVNTANDPRWRPLSDMALDVYRRYGSPLIIAETSHPGEHRPDWILSVAGECAAIIGHDVPLWGVCLYPIISRPDWDNPAHWHHPGLWDINVNDGQANRILNLEYARALQQSQQLIARCNNAIV